MKIVTSVMHYSSYAKRLFQLCAFCLAILTPLMACSDTKTINWREEVKLSNGQVIVVQRSEEYRLVGEDIVSRWLFSRENIEAILPTPTSTKVVWDGRLKPIAIDVAKDGVIYLVTVVATAQGAREYSVSDDVNHVAFKYAGPDHWERIPVESVPHEIRPNLLAMTHTLFIEQKYSTGKVIDLSLKQRIDSDPRLVEKYKRWPTK